MPLADSRDSLPSLDRDSLPSLEQAGSAALAARIRAEYEEMPCLCLTLGQAVRLWNLDAQTCAGVLEELRCQGYLRMAHTRYLRAS